MKYIMAEIVSGYDSDGTFVLDVLNPSIMLGNQYPLTDSDVDVMKGHYMDEHGTNTTSVSTGISIIGYFIQEDLKYPLLNIDKRILDYFISVREQRDNAILYNTHTENTKPFLNCVRSEHSSHVELSFLDNGDWYVVSVIDLYVLYLGGYISQVLPDTITNLIISRMSNQQKEIGLMKYYKEFI